jgi:hypothetical protein
MVGRVDGRMDGRVDGWKEDRIKAIKAMIHE